MDHQGVFAGEVKKGTPKKERARGTSGSTTTSHAQKREREVGVSECVFFFPLAPACKLGLEVTTDEMREGGGGGDVVYLICKPVQ